MEHILDIEKIPKTLSVEEVAPFYIEESHLPVIAPKYSLRRIDSKGARYYYKEDEEQNIVFYYSVTSFCKSVQPTSEYLIDWRVRLGKEDSKELSELTANYGTFVHILMAEFLKDGVYDHGETHYKLMEFMQHEGVPMKYFSYWMDDAENDMLAFAQWCFEKEVYPIAIEYQISNSCGLCGTADLICQLKFNGKKELALVDFKSGRKGFWESHELQLHTMKWMWNEAFKIPTYQIKHVFNWSPKNWTKSPTYNFKNQTSSIEGKKLPHYLETFKLAGYAKPNRNVKTQIKPLVLGESTEGKFQVKTFEQIAKENLNKNKN